MSTLNHVVDAMSKETNNSTLGWDVVVNYTSHELNKLLAAAHQSGHQQGQLRNIKVPVGWFDEDENPIQYWYDFKLGAPLIQFNYTSGDPTCQLRAPVTGGTIERTSPPERRWDIPANKYHLTISGILLASVDGKVSGSRTLIPSNRPFVFQSDDQIGIVTLDFHTSVLENKIDIRLEGEGLHMLDGVRRTAVVGGILDFLEEKGRSIHLDLSQVRNSKPPPSNSISLVPEKFQFAAYRSKDSKQYSILSLFIHIKGQKFGGRPDELQTRWANQWLEGANTYGVPPIPNDYTASIIFNNALIQQLVKNSLQSQDLKFDEIEKTKNDRWALKWKVRTGLKFHAERINHKASSWPYSRYIVDEINLDLDSRSTEGLYVTIGQNGDSNANALLKWEFSATTGWSWHNGATGASEGGDVTITNKLDTKKHVDKGSLPEYRVRLDANVGKNDWHQSRKATNTDWESVARQTNYEAFLHKALPSPPVFNLKLFDIYFFMTTNLLLPGEEVIIFDATTGARFPRDLYLVGKIASKARAVELREQSLALPS